MIERVQARSRTTGKALNCPAFVCDVCRELVHGKGNVQWYERQQPDGTHAQVTPYLVCHKHPCSDALDQRYNERYRPEDGHARLWTDIGTFVEQLTKNAASDLRDDEDDVRITPPIM